MNTMEEKTRIPSDAPTEQHKEKFKSKVTVFDVINYSLLTLFGLICIFPVAYVLLLSFASKADYLNANLMVIPRDFNFEAYKYIFGQGRVPRAFGISAIITVGGTLYSMLLTSLGAYAFTRKNIPGLKICFTVILITMFFSGGIIPFYLAVKSMMGLNNLGCIVLPFGINTFNMIILRNFFSQVPESLLESCRMEGASEFRVLFQFVIPLSKAGLATVALWYLVGKWDDWYWPSFFLPTADNLYPLALELRNVLNNMAGETPVDPNIGLDGTKLFSQGQNAAMIVVSITPILLIYPFLQKYFVKGVMIGSVKE